TVALPSRRSSDGNHGPANTERVVAIHPSCSIDKARRHERDEAPEKEFEQVRRRVASPLRRTLTAPAIYQAPQHRRTYGQALQQAGTFACIRIAPFRPRFVPNPPSRPPSALLCRTSSGATPIPIRAWSRGEY